MSRHQGVAPCLCVPFPKPTPTVIRCGQPKPPGHGTTSTVSRCSGGTPRRSLRRRVAGFTRSSFKKPVIGYTGDTDIASLLNRDTFEPSAAVFVVHEASSMAALVVRGLLRRASLSGTPHGHFLLSTHPQCCGQETRRFQLTPTSSRSHVSAQRRLHWEGLQQERILHCW